MTVNQDYPSRREGTSSRVLRFIALALAIGALVFGIIRVLAGAPLNDLWIPLLGVVVVLLLVGSDSRR